MPAERPAASIDSCKIETASWRDLNALRRLEKVCFPNDFWPLFDLIGVLAFPGVVRLKAVKDDLMVGFVAGDVRTPGTGWITTIGVLPEFRRRGIGSALLVECEERLQCPQIRLNVKVANTAANRLYQSLGYQPVTVIHNYYQDGDDALVLKKDLREAGIITQ